MYPQPHMLFAVQGQLGSSRTSPFETFSFGIRFISDTTGGVGGLDAIDTDAHGQALAESFQNTWRNVNSGVNDMALITLMKWNRIGTDGRYASDESRDILPSETIGLSGGGKPTYYLPPQCSLAITLRTGKSRGLARAGRFYLPAPSFATDNNTGQLSTTDALRVANCWGAWLDGLAITVGPLNVGLQAVVMSKGRGSGSGPGAMNRVNAVEVGRVIDTMRSRRRAIKEDYVTHPFGNV